MNKLATSNDTVLLEVLVAQIAVWHQAYSVPFVVDIGIQRSRNFLDFLHKKIKKIISPIRTNIIYLICDVTE